MQRKPWIARIEFAIMPEAPLKGLAWYMNKLDFRIWVAQFCEWRGKEVSNYNVLDLEAELQLMQQLVEYERGIPCRIVRQYISLLPASCISANASANVSPVAFLNDSYYLHEK